MRFYRAAMFGAALALPLAVGGFVGHAHAQNSLGDQVQRLFNGNNNNDQNAYERGREDQLRQQQAQRERWRETHPYAQNDRERDWRDRGDHYGDNGYRNDNGYNNGYNNGYR